MQAFRDRLQAYSQGTPPGQVAPSYSGFISRIESIGNVEPRDRIGVRLREEGFTNAEDFSPDRSFVLDLELWDVGRRGLRTRKLEQIATTTGIPESIVGSDGSAPTSSPVITPIEVARPGSQGTRAGFPGR